VVKKLQERVDDLTRQLAAAGGEQQPPLSGGAHTQGGAGGARAHSRWMPVKRAQTAHVAQ
jgi:hypothetical protein